MTNRALIIIISLIILAGCTTSCAPTIQLKASPALIFDARPLIPEPWYEQLYDNARSCAKHIQRLPRGHGYGKIDWYVVPRHTMAAYINAIGLWGRPNRIYLDERVVADTMIIKHELLHYILQREDSIHTAAAFQACSNTQVKPASIETN